jgi:hypothetical protein
MRAEIAQEGLKATPPVLVTTAAVSNAWTPTEWMALATIIYIVLQAGYLVWKWYKEYRDSR